MEIVPVRKNQVDLYEGLRSGDLDVIVGYPSEVKDMPNIVIKKCTSHRLCLVVNEEHPLASEEIVDPQAFANERFIVPNEEMFPQIKQEIESVCLEMGFRPNTVDAATDMDSLLMMVEIGLGVALLSPNGRHCENDHLRFIDINAESELNVFYGVAYLSDNSNPSLQVFLKLFEEFEKEGKLNV